MQHPPVALITGAASGIGRQLALDLGRDGYVIAALDLNGDGLRGLAEELARLGIRHATAVADVTGFAALDDAVRDLESQLGPTDLLIASAGIGLETSALNYCAADVAKVININLIGVSNSIAAVLPGMLERKRGHLVALSSVASFRGLPRMLAYCASKSGLNALMDGLRVEVHGQGVHTTIVCPGWVRTPMTAQIQGRLDHLLEPEAASRYIRQAIRRKQAFCAFPAPLVRRLRFVTWLPRSWQDWMIRRMVGNLKTRPGGMEPQMNTDGHR